MKKQKNLRKLIATTLAVLLLMSIVPLQSFAAFSLFNPNITSIAFEEGAMISMKEIERLHDYYGEDSLQLRNYLDYPYGSDFGSGFYYDNLIVSFSNGKTVELDRLFDEIPSTTSYSGPNFNVSYEDCKKAIENGDDTVPVNVELTISFERGKNKRFEGEVDCKIVESYVKSIKPAGELNPYYERMDSFDCFVGQEMIIEYADGTTKTAEITEGEYTGWFGPLKLDGRPIAAKINDGDDEFYETPDYVAFYYCDAIYEAPLTVIPAPYRRIDIVDYTIENMNVLTSITYTLTKINGETETYTKECNVTDYEDNVTIDKIGAYRVDVDLNIDVATSKQNSVGKIHMYLGSGTSEGSYRYYDYEEYDASDYCNCICHKKGIAKIVYSILVKIWDLFGINEQCRCGAWHWDE